MQDLITFLDPEYLTNLVVTYIPRVVTAILVFFAFWLLIRVTRPALRTSLRRAAFDGALIKLLVDNVYRYTLLLVGLIMAASQLGVDVAAALTGLGVAGIAVGFAAQDSVANTIAGFLIFWDQPFAVGQIVETQDQYGEVVSITMRTTRIRTPNNTYVIVPNKEIIEAVLVNHSMYGETRVDVPVGIGYPEDVEEARKVLLDAVSTVEGVAEEPAPAVVVKELGGSSVNLEVRVWVMEASREKATYVRTLERCKRALNDAGIEIPFPHLQLQVDEVKEPIWERVERIPNRASAERGQA
jgi:small conductance mechanosensitive channel